MGTKVWPIGDDMVQTYLAKKHTKRAFYGCLVEVRKIVPRASSKDFTRFWHRNGSNYIIPYGNKERYCYLWGQGLMYDAMMKFYNVPDDDDDDGISIL